MQNEKLKKQKHLKGKRDVLKSIKMYHLSSTLLLNNAIK